MTFIRIIIIYKTTFIQLMPYVQGDSIIQHSIILYTHVTITYIHGVDSFALFSVSPCFPCRSLFTPLCTPIPLTWRPPAVTGIVLPLLRLLVNWPYLPTLHTIVPPFPISQNPNCPTPSNDDIGTAPLWLCGTTTVCKYRDYFYVQITKSTRNTCTGSILSSWSSIMQTTHRLLTLSLTAQVIYDLAFLMENYSKKF